MRQHERARILFRRSWSVWLSLSLIFLALGSVAHDPKDQSKPQQGITFRILDSQASIPVGIEHVVPVALTNHSSRAITILGGSVECGAQGCLRTLDLPLELPEGSTREIHLLVSPRSPGPFDLSVTLFTTLREQAQFEIRYRTLCTDEGRVEISLRD